MKKPPQRHGGCATNLPSAQARSPATSSWRAANSAPDSLQDEASQSSSVTVTGTWSDGRSQALASRVIRKSLTRSFRARETQMWSSLRPRSPTVQSATQKHHHEKTNTDIEM